jgi:hypothetical protein
VSVNPDLVEELARLGDAVLYDLFREARAERRRRIETALRDIRSSMLPSLSTRKAARAIHDAVRRNRANSDADLRRVIKRRLQAELGYLNDVPGEERIRQLLGNE